MRACYLTNRRINEKRNESGNHRIDNARLGLGLQQFGVDQPWRCNARKLSALALGHGVDEGRCVALVRWHEEGAGVDGTGTAMQHGGTGW